jgi:hypothetical protein
MNSEEDILKILMFLGESTVKDMRALIELNGAIASGNLYDNIRVAAMKLEGKYTLVISYPFYGKFVDKGRSLGGMPPVQDIRDWCRLKGIPESAAFPIAKKIAREGYKGIHFTEPFYDDIKVIKDIMGKEYKDYVIKALIKDVTITKTK